jgi:hypothetical protein
MTPTQRIAHPVPFDPANRGAMQTAYVESKHPDVQIGLAMPTGTVAQQAARIAYFYKLLESGGWLNPATGLHQPYEPFDQVLDVEGLAVLDINSLRISDDYAWVLALGQAAPVDGKGAINTQAYTDISLAPAGAITFISNNPADYPAFVVPEAPAAPPAQPTVVGKFVGGGYYMPGAAAFNAQGFPTVTDGKPYIAPDGSTVYAHVSYNASSGGMAQAAFVVFFTSMPPTA